MKDEALKLAIKAMKSFQNETNGLYKGEFEEEIKACEEALAQQEQEPDDLTIAYMSGYHDGKKAQPKEPKQEPVAIVDANDDGYWADILPGKDVKVGQYFYTTPPQRTWVGLTDEEVFDVWLNEMPAPDKVFYQKLCRSIEAKLKEKNE